VAIRPSLGRFDVRGALVAAALLLAAFIVWGIGQDVPARIAAAYLTGFAQGFIGGFLSTPGGLALTIAVAFVGGFIRLRGH
jgi:hypothetical protein